MNVQPAAFLRTTLPLDLSSLPAQDSGRYHSVWLPDHMVSFWPESIWTPEFTDLATTRRRRTAISMHSRWRAPSPFRRRMCRSRPVVVDTVRRHPAMLAQTALTLDHLVEGPFHPGRGQRRNREHRALWVRLLETGEPVRGVAQGHQAAVGERRPGGLRGSVLQLHHARMDTEPFEGRFPRIWVGCSGPRMLEITGRYADGWWAAGAWTPEDYASKLKTIRDSAERAGRDPMAIMPANMTLVSSAMMRSSRRSSMPHWSKRVCCSFRRKHCVSLASSIRLARAGAAIRTSTRRAAAGTDSRHAEEDGRRGNPRNHPLRHAERIARNSKASSTPACGW